MDVYDKTKDPNWLASINEAVRENRKINNPQLTEKNHIDMTDFLGHVLDYYKDGDVTKARAVESLAHVITALDKNNYGEVVNWFEQGRKLILRDVESE